MINQIFRSRDEYRNRSRFVRRIRILEYWVEIGKIRYVDLLDLALKEVEKSKE